MPHTFSAFRSEQRMRGRKAPRGEEITIRFEDDAPPTKGLTCHVRDCGRVAWYVTGIGSVRRGWCGAHYAQAKAAATREAGKLSPEAVLKWHPMGER